MQPAHRKPREWSQRTRTGLPALALLLIIPLALVLSGCGRSANNAPLIASAVGQIGAGANPEPLVTEGGSVTVAVLWPGPSSGLVFEVILDTHSVDLDGYDLSKLAVLRADGGIEVRPSGWDAPPGGHHREGKLTFPTATADGRPVLGAGVQAITLIIRDVAGVPERSYRWTW